MENNNTNEKSENETQKSNYLPDADSKALLKGLSQKKLKLVLEYLFSIKFPKNCKIITIDTESSIVTGYDGKGYVKSDLIFQILNDGDDNVEKIIIEFQTTPDDEMGYRLFIYSLNHSKILKIDGELYCEPAMCMTIYTTLHKPLYGVDKVKVKKYKYKCTKLLKHELVDTNEYYEFEYPFINILAMTLEDLEELSKDELDIFIILYLYRYKKNSKLLLNPDFYEIAKKSQEIIKKYDDKDFEILVALMIKLMRDIEKILKTKQKENIKYGEVLDIMESTKVFKELEYIRSVKAEGREEGRLINSLELAQVMLETHEFEELSKLLKIPVSYIQAIFDGCDIEDIVQKHFAKE